MGMDTTISLGAHFERFIEEGVANGKYKDPSEVIRAGLRLLEEKEKQVAALKTAIKDGIDSGVAINFDTKKHLENLKAKRVPNG